MKKMTTINLMRSGDGKFRPLPPERLSEVEEFVQNEGAALEADEFLSSGISGLLELRLSDQLEGTDLNLENDEVVVLSEGRGDATITGGLRFEKERDPYKAERGDTRLRRMLPDESFLIASEGLLSAHAEWKSGTSNKMEFEIGEPHSYFHYYDKDSREGQWRERQNVSLLERDADGNTLRKIVINEKGTIRYSFPSET